MGTLDGHLLKSYHYKMHYIVGYCYVVESLLFKTIMGYSTYESDELSEIDPYEEVSQQGRYHHCHLLMCSLWSWMSISPRMTIGIPRRILEEVSEGSNETEPFKEDKTAVTPPPPRHRGARISVRPQTPMVASTQALIDAFAAGSPLFLLPPTSLVYDQASLEISDTAARAPREDVGYVRALQASEHRTMTSIKEVNLRIIYQAQVRKQESKYFYTQLYDAQTDHRDIRLEIDVVRGQRTGYETELQERQSAEDLAVTQMMRIHILEARAWTDTVEDADSSLISRIMPVTRQGTNDAMTLESIQATINRGTEGIVGLSQWLEKMKSLFYINDCAIDSQVKFATCTLLGAALTWWNGHVRTLGHDAAYAMTWGTLKKKLTDKYCPKGEIKKFEIELWNLRVKGNDVVAYTQRLQELALMCTKFLVDETEKVDKYISGLSDNIHENVMSARPKTLDETIELANDLMDQKLRTYVEKLNDNKRKADDSSRNNQQQQPHKKQNVARAYTNDLGEKKAYTRNLPLCTKYNYHHTVECAPKCNNCKKYGHATRDCRVNVNNKNRVLSMGKCFECREPRHFKKNCPKLKNNGNANGNDGARAKAYVLGGGDSNPKSNIVTGTFLPNNRYASILFDTGVDRSFVSTAFSALLNIVPTALDNHYDVKLADGKIIGVNTILRGCTLEFLNHPFNIDLMPVPLGSFDVIIGMDWLREYHAVKFQIYLVPGAAPVARAPYRLAPAEMK
nr:reverse transcriptase domain-containing protein [Tanacetum cinerariifolium]